MEDEVRIKVVITADDGHEKIYEGMTSVMVAGIKDDTTIGTIAGEVGIETMMRMYRGLAHAIPDARVAFQYPAFCETLAEKTGADVDVIAAKLSDDTTVN